MGSDVSAKFFDVLQKHLELGTSLKHANFSPAQRRRAEVCLDVYRKLEENEMMDRKRYLRQRWGRTETEIRQDLRVINWLLAELNDDTTELSRYRVEKQANRIISMGQNMGEWKAIEAGAKLLIKVKGLDKPDTDVDVEGNTHPLPPVIVDTPKNGVRYDEAQLDKLRKKYHAEKDKTQELVEAKMGLFVEAGSIVSDVQVPELAPMQVVTDEPRAMEMNILDGDDPDDDGL